MPGVGMCGGVRGTSIEGEMAEIACPRMVHIYRNPQNGAGGRGGGDGKGKGGGSSETHGGGVRKE